MLYHHCPTLEAVDKLAAERGYKNRDQVCVSPATMGDVYEEKVKMFFAEHLHEDEEIRYILDGEGYFDVRGQEDEWIRICLNKDDMIILPAGIYHRFTTNEQNVCAIATMDRACGAVVLGCVSLTFLLQYVKAMRLFQDEPKWTPLNRGAEVDVNPHRKTYVDSVLKPAAVA